MVKTTPLRLLGSSNNARGDLFTRLTGDLFFALGYDELRFDVHKSGRELDIQGTHRLLPRRMVAECKAHADKMGGEDLNKFFGVLSRERSRDKETPVDGFFVSLNGFRETGIEQEQQTAEQDRIILVDGQRAINELIRVQILISLFEATERAGRCAAQAGLTDSVIDGTELLGHPLGYIWAVYYSQGKQRTHFALIHADGTPLATAVAREVIQVDRECEGSLHVMTYLSPPPSAPDRDTLAKAAVERYRQWVVQECGEIQLDGLPADAKLSAFSMQLERLFVPVKVVASVEEVLKGGTISSREAVYPVGEFLARHPRFSLLAKPGGGKSTLLKRLAVAYANPTRRTEAYDQLPERDWLPLLLRCRELHDPDHRSILELLEDLAKHAGMNGGETSLFRDQIDDALRSGQALLLVDGLDEIADQGARRAFAGHLRSFLAMFPNVAMVVTSREAGYRHVAGVIASSCESVRLAPFDESDVTRLCESWHAVVVGETETIRKESRELAETIWSNERIRALAENPLMLTTLLVVRRCIGDLPTRRVELYREAVKVLIRTWNTEGFDPMELDETLAQLSYVACVMMNEGLQRVGHRRLLKLLQEAREEMQAELQFTKISPAEFVDRVEYRSSLLMQTGHERIDGELQPVYEFRHLTFQEYLAARGLVEEQYPGRDQGNSIVELLVPHFEDVTWREVVPLAAVMAGRKAESLIQELTEKCENHVLECDYPMPEDVTAPPVVLLRQCLLDEVQVTPVTLRAALRQMGRMGAEQFAAGSVIQLRRGRFGELFQEVVEKAFVDRADGWVEFKTAMSDLAVITLFADRSLELSQHFAATLSEWLKSPDHLLQTRAAFVCMHLAFRSTRIDDTDIDCDGRSTLWLSLRDTLGSLLTQGGAASELAASWALAWAGERRVTLVPPSPHILLSLFRLWNCSEIRESRRLASWAFSAQPLMSRDAIEQKAWGECESLFKDWDSAVRQKEDQKATLVLAWYRRRPWSDVEIVQRIRQLEWRDWPTGAELLVALNATDQEK